MFFIFRKIAKNYVFKMIFVIIIGSLLAWGLGDVIKSSKSDDVVVINGKYRISQLDFERNKANYVRNIENNLNQKLPLNQLNNSLINKMVLDNLINLKIFEVLGDKLNLNISEEILANKVKLDYNLENEKSNFDKENFYQLLRNNALSEKDFSKIMSVEQIKDFLEDSLCDLKIYPEKFTEILSIYLNEKRNFSLCYIPTSILDIKSPSQEDLLATYEKNKNLFLMPETRNISYIELSPENVKANIKISEGEVKEEYKNYIVENYTLEKRDFLSLKLDDKEKAEEALKLLKAGHNFEKLAEKYLDNPEENLLMKAVLKNDLPLNMQKEVFDLKKGEISKIIDSNEAFYLVKMIDIYQVSHPKFELVRQDLYSDLMRKKSEEIIYEYVKIIKEEILQEGKNLNLIAKNFNLPVVSVKNLTMEANKDSHANLPNLENIKQVIFGKKAGEFELIEDQTGTKYYVFFINEVEPQKYKTMEASVGDLTNLWKQSQADSQVKILDSIIANKDNGKYKNIQEFAAEKSLKFEAGHQIHRKFEMNDKLVMSLPEALLGEIMKVKKNDVTKIYKYKSEYGDYVLAQLQDVEFTKEKNLSTKTIKIYNKKYEENILNNLIEYMRSNSDIKINYNLLSSGWSETNK